MNKTLIILIAAAALSRAAEKTLQMKDLPAAVQKAIQDQTKGAEIKGLAKETEHGVTSYEVETVRNGKHRDLDIDSKGAVLAVEEETSIDSIPAAAKAALEKKAVGGKITLVETVTKGGAIFYEVSYTTKNGKKFEATVKPDGSAVSN